MNEPVIEIEHVSKSFGKNHVLTDFNMQVNRGENVVVLGKSGSGKSVLIKCVIGLLSIDAGDIRVFGTSINQLTSRQLDQFRRRIGFLFQSNALYDSNTVRENLEFPLRRHFAKASKEEVNNWVMEALENVGLAHTVDLMPSELARGMRKRIALARTLSCVCRRECRADITRHSRPLGPQRQSQRAGAISSLSAGNSP